MRNLINKNKNDGFTIIEVVLVLAIAGLIFLVVFLALPQLQESRRDNQRRRDVERLAAGINTYKLNNQQDVPDDAAAFNLTTLVADYIENFEDPSLGATYTIVATAPAQGEIRYLVDADCSATAAGAAAATSRNFAVTIGLEQGTYCVEG